MNPGTCRTWNRFVSGNSHVIRNTVPSAQHAVIVNGPDLYVIDVVEYSHHFFAGYILSIGFLEIVLQEILRYTDPPRMQHYS